MMKISQEIILADQQVLSVDYLITNLVFVLFYAFFETVTKRRTVGKMITGTRAVKNDGSKLLLVKRYEQVFTLAWFLFEPFSAFSGFPWHDKWTGRR